MRLIYILELNNRGTRGSEVRLRTHLWYTVHGIDNTYHRILRYVLSMATATVHPIVVKAVLIGNTV